MDKIIDEIKKIKEEYGKSLVILGHHYQRDEIIEVSDYIGDSYYLAKSSANERQAKYIVFCGVRFMAEAAEILSSPEQKVLHPEKDAGCPLADTADLESVEYAWKEIKAVYKESKIVPITYINSDANLKAFCGENSGLVCTSSNAAKAFDWAKSRGEKLFFFPDQHLGRNTAVKKGIKDEEIVLWKQNEELGGNSPDEIKRAKIVLWDGHCHVHTFFTKEDIQKLRKEYKGIKVIVHPECPKGVVKASDETGSTSFLVNYVEMAPKGSIIAVGTEINLVSRLAKKYKDKKIIELKRSLCPNMYKISPEKLLYTLRNLESFEPVTLPDKTKANATLALRRMLEV